MTLLAVKKIRFRQRRDHPAHRTTNFELTRSLVTRHLGYSAPVQQPWPAGLHSRVEALIG